MNNENSVLPADFDGVFRFTNATEEDFTALWGKVAYTFPAQSTTPMIISNATPEEVQYIRKKFAKELAEREFYKGARIAGYNKQNEGVGSVHSAVTYSQKDLEVYIQQCLTPLPVGQAKVRVLPAEDETKFKKDEDGEPITQVMDHKSKKSLIGKGNVVA